MDNLNPKPRLRAILIEKIKFVFATIIFFFIEVDYPTKSGGRHYFPTKYGRREL